MAYFKCKPGGVELVPWNGDLTKVKAMIDAYYAGDITLNDIKSVWQIGDKRNVLVSAISAATVSGTTFEAVPQQYVTMAIMNWGGKSLVSNGQECLAIIGQVNSLNTAGVMNKTDSNGGGWASCPRRAWVNSNYKDALPSGFVDIIKQHQCKTSEGGSSVTATADYFALPAEKEVWGSNTYANATAESSLTQFEYYQSSSNRIKKLGNAGSANSWWHRSPRDGTYTSFCMINQSGYARYSAASSSLGIAPYGCI